MHLQRTIFGVALSSGGALILQYLRDALGSPISPSAVHGPAASRGLLESRNAGSSPDLQNQSPHLNEIPRDFGYTLKLKKYCFGTLFYGMLINLESMINLPNIDKILRSNISDTTVHNNYL